jgi:hypothetical protein
MKTKRIKTRLAPGLGFKLKQQATGQDKPPKISYGRAAAIIFKRQFTRCRDWNPQPIIARWSYRAATPGQHAKAPATVTPGLLPGARLDEIVEGLYWHLSAINAPFQGVPELDEIVHGMRDEVLQLLLPAAARELDRFRSALLAQTQFGTADFDNCATAMNRLIKSMPMGKYPPADRVQDFRNFLRLCGLLRRFNGHIFFDAEPPAGADEILNVPVDAEANKKLDDWNDQTGLEKKQIVAALLISGVTLSLPAQQHLDAILEFVIFAQTLNMLRKMFNFLLELENNRLEAESCPNPDPGMNSFIKAVRSYIQELRQKGEALEQVLTVAMDARRDMASFATTDLCWQAHHLDSECSRVGNQLTAKERLLLSEFLPKLKPDVWDFQ